jgi:hypothetical protein
MAAVETPHGYLGLTDSIRELGRYVTALTSSFFPLL